MSYHGVLLGTVSSLYSSHWLFSSCKEITNAVKKNCSIKFGLWDDEHPTERFTFCEFETFDGLSINQTMRGDPGEMYGVPLNHTILVKSGSDFTAGALRGGYGLSSWPYGGSLMNVSILRGSVERDGSTPVNATQCTLYWCINTYESSMANGIFTEKTLDSWTMPPTVLWQGTNGHRNSYNYTLTPAPVHADLTPPSTFFVGERASVGLRDWLWSTLRFTNSWAVWEESRNSSTRLVLGPDFSNSLYFTDMNDLCDEEHAWNDLVDLFLEREPRDVFDGLAKSMTTYIRSFDDGDLTAGYHGFFNITEEDSVRRTSCEVQAYIAIRWGWLAFSASLYVTPMYELHVRLILTSSTGFKGHAHPALLCTRGLAGSVEWCAGVEVVAAGALVSWAGWCVCGSGAE
jgi:hypothetical protein